VKFLVDAQLPIRLAKLLRKLGHDAIHTLDLPSQNTTSDSHINQLSMQQERIVITKDRDFLDSFLLRGIPFGDSHEIW
jgi:predicted nuclease of predicted toxin-antitoxin system